ncbi:MAG: DUF4013 domain-containing protein [Candidatus Aenigmatarchaeota archaeon]
MNYEEAIKKPFTDLGKLILGIILSVVPIVNWIAQGFIIECSGVGKNKPSKKMPEWKELSDYFIKGFLSYLIIFIYLIPAIIVFIIVVGYAASSLIPSLMGMTSESFINSVMANQISSQQIRQLISQNFVTALPSLIAIAPLVILALIFLIIASYLSPIAILNYLKNKRFGKAFDFSFIFSKAFTANYFIAWLISCIIAVLLKTILSFIPWIGFAIAYFISGVIAYSLYGQAFREK